MVDSVDDPVFAHDVGGVGCPPGVVVELTDEGLVDVDLSELALGREDVAAHGLDLSQQFVGEEILRDDVGQDDLLGQAALVGLEGAVGRGEDGERADPPEDLGEPDLVDGVLELVEVVVSLDLRLALALEPREVAVVHAGTLEGSEGAQDALLAAVLSQRVRVGVSVERRHVQGRRRRRGRLLLLLLRPDGKGRGRSSQV
mmetsp:Transcript_2022/g.5331  ORF Transcript_2022/g.5331 Transcript_2022/m.5331 type:complete len:200 (-) Transcript_2022:149-748(-)